MFTIPHIPHTEQFVFILYENIRHNFTTITVNITTRIFLLKKCQNTSFTIMGGKCLNSSESFFHLVIYFFRISESILAFDMFLYVFSRGEYSKSVCGI